MMWVESLRVTKNPQQPWALGQRVFPPLAVRPASVSTSSCTYVFFLAGRKTFLVI